MSAVLQSSVLAEIGVAHAFGGIGAPVPDDVLRPKQVHGTRVVRVRDAAIETTDLGEADAVVATRAGAAVGVVTADCVPLLLASADGRAVAAVHAGWRGLAAGVIEAAVASLAREAALASLAREVDATSLHAAVGPCIGPCCYEVDAPVLEAMGTRLDAPHCRPRESRPGHAQLDLAALAQAALHAAGVAPHCVERLPDACTSCGTERFHSYRRDGAAAGRMLHWVRVARAKGV